MKELFETMLALLESRRDAVLCTILATSGSSPRGAGSRMLVTIGGEPMGTIGGGTVELAAIQQAREALHARQSLVKGYRLAPNEVEDIGMICGGAVTVYFQFWDHADARALETLRAIVALLLGDESAWLVCRISEGAMSRMGVYDEAHGLRFFDEPLELAPLLKTRAVYVKGEPSYYAEPIKLAGKVYLFGGGHVGQALVPVLARVGFEVVVFDNREKLARASVFPQAQRVVLGDYGDIGASVRLTKDDYVVIMTPGHQADFEVLRQALRTKATYVGCIGSRRKVAATREKLLAAGLCQADVERVHSPIGLAIGAETPEEIAISVAAEMIAHRASLR